MNDPNAEYDGHTDLTVAAIVERDGRFLMIEEMSAGKIVLNQPSGHIETGESPEQAVIRETLEESAWHIRPSHLIGVYSWIREATGQRFLRIAYAAEALRHDPEIALDACIVAAYWLTPRELLSKRLACRSPMVVRCVDDYLAGTHYAKSNLDQLLSVQQHLNAVAATAAVV